MAVEQIKIPNLGDIDEVEVIELCVSPGDQVETNDTILVIESDKASMDVPAGMAGKIVALTVTEGDQVSEGSVIAEIEVAGASAPDDGAAGENDAVVEPEADAPPVEAVPAPSVAAPVETSAATQDVDILVPDIGDAGEVVIIEVSVAVGDQIEQDGLVVVLESDKASMEVTADHAGEILEVFIQEDQTVETGTLLARVRTSGQAGVEQNPPVEQSSEPGPSTVAAEPKPPAPAPPSSPQPSSEKPAGPAADAGAREVAATAAAKVYAGPATRRLARELGVDLTQVAGSGPRQRIVKDDVKAFVKHRMTSAAPASGGAGLPKVADVDFSRFGDIEQVELSRIRQRGADNLHRSWVNLPHVTQHDEVDITDLEDFRKALKAEAEQRGVKVTPLAFIVQACARVLTEYPEFNSSLAQDQKHLILKSYINIGMAVDTPEGLVVPVIKDADQKDIWTLSEDIAGLSQRARDKKLGMDELSGGTFSVSSLGALGGTGFTPIVNAPEVAILGVARLATKPWWNGEGFEPRKVLPLSLSYDHRVINGADGGRFMLRLTELLGDYRRMAL